MNTKTAFYSLLFQATLLNMLHAGWNTSPTTLDSGQLPPNASSSAYIVADASGNVTAAWLENINSTVVQAASYTKATDSWSAPTIIDQDNGAAAQPHLVVDTSGIVTAVWIEYLGGSYLIQAARFNGTAWTTPVTLNNGIQSPNAYLSFSPKPVVDASGNVTVVWFEQQGSQYAVQAARFSEGTWTTSPTTLNGNTPNAFVNISPQTVVDKLGNVTTVWFEQQGSTYAVQAARFAENNWTVTPTTLDGNLPNAYQNFTPQTIVDELNNVTVTWTEYHGSALAIETARFSDNAWTPAVILNNGIQTPNAGSSAYIVADAPGNVTAAWLENITSTVVQAAYYTITTNSWSAPTIIDQENGAAAQPSLVVDTSGVVTAVWIEYLGGSYLIQAARFNGTAWTTPVTLNNGTQSPNAYLSFSPQAIIDLLGNVTVAWFEQQGSQYAVQAARFSAGTWTTSPATLNGNIPNAAISTPLLIIPSINGTAYVAWLEQKDSALAIEASRLSGNTWAPAALLNNGIQIPNAFSSTSLQLIADIYGNATATWLENNMFPVAVQATRYTVPKPLPPTELKGYQAANRFLTQSEYNNILSWNAPLLRETPVAYRIYRDATLSDLVGTVYPRNGKQLIFIDHNRINGNIYTYYIVSVDAQGTLSEPATIVIP